MMDQLTALLSDLIYTDNLKTNVKYLKLNVFLSLLFVFLSCIWHLLDIKICLVFGICHFPMTMFYVCICASVCNYFSFHLTFSLYICINVILDFMVIYDFNIL